MVENQMIYGLDAFANWLGQEHDSRFVYIFDENTRVHCEPKMKQHNVHVDETLVIASGEHHKHLGTCEKIWEQLMNLKADRNTIVVNVGGGMLTDTGGFAAATFKRGIRFINVPTTLLAMVDASIGNKTGVNFNGIKNQLGTFSPAHKIVIDTTFLATLSKAEIRSGLGEVLKYGFIYDQDILSKNLDTISIDMVKRCIEIKNEIVAQDPLESGLRQILNFGHTIGHGLEAYGHQLEKPLKHGEGVALGMLAECFLSEKKLGFTKLDTALDVIGSKFRVPDWLADEQSYQDILEFVKHDKKNKGAEIRCTMLKDIAKPEYGQHLHEGEVIDSLKWLATL